VLGSIHVDHRHAIARRHPALGQRVRQAIRPRGQVLERRRNAVKRDRRAVGNNRRSDGQNVVSVHFAMDPLS